MAATVKRDTLPKAKYVTNNVINTSKTKEDNKKRNVSEFLGKTIDAISNNKLPPTIQMFETKINCHPHYKYKSEEGVYVSILVGSKKWALERVEEGRDGDYLGRLQGRVMSTCLCSCTR
ncbi:hypothetical protein QQS21_010101 [Conoideocrella luteorostrata]|uniref:Uncharacterized protein n=1 Tax=Conoideocrella luteorostrata TaxID=1105319 RepID=A0AAJ0FV23_9HYPO|nr:hypothetical protein QQS21_010101 [Conoideocrella luteorostrata]